MACPLTLLCKQVNQRRSTLLLPMRNLYFSKASEGARYKIFCKTMQRIFFQKLAGEGGVPLGLGEGQHCLAITLCAPEFSFSPTLAQ